VAVPLLFVRHGGDGLTKLALVVGLGAAAEVVSTPILVLTQPARPLRRLFAGYVTIGLSLAAMGLAAGLPGGWQLAGLCAAAVVMGVGNSTATLQITTFLATRLPRDDYAAVLRLRMVTIIGSMILATGAGPLILEALGPAGTILICGLAGAAAGLAGMLGRPARRLGPGFEPA
jgi:hypothetical protein